MKYQGILPDRLDDPEFVRRCEEHERQFKLMRDEEAVEAERAAALQGVIDEIEATMIPFLHQQAKEVNGAARITPGDRKIFEDFKKYCAEGWDVPLPPLPAHPAACAAYLTTKMGHSLAHFMKHFHAISRVHLAVGMPDPTRDVLCASLQALVVRQSQHKDK